MNARALGIGIALTVAVAAISVTAISPEEQRIRDLQAQIAALEQQAAQYRQSIASEREKAASLKKEIAILRNQVGQLEAQIASTDMKIELTETEIGQVQESIAQKRDAMSRKRETMGRMVLFLEQRDREPLVATLFKFANLSQFFRELDDAAAVQARLMDIISELKQTKALLEQEQAALEGKHEELEDLNEQALQRRDQLAGVQAERNRVLKATQGQEAKYQQQLSEVEKKKAAFFNELRELELKVVSGGLYIVHVKADAVPPPGTKLFSWPEDGYVLTQGYGYTTYAKRGAYGGAPHNGIDMAAGFGSPIKAIGDGLIVANGNNRGFGNWIAVQHPNNMVSVYGHMSSFNISLRVGSNVTRGQVIGYEGSTGNSTGSHLHLSLYREFFTYLKPGTGELYFNYFEGTVDPRGYL